MVTGAAAGRGGRASVWRAGRHGGGQRHRTVHWTSPRTCWTRSSPRGPRRVAVAGDISERSTADELVRTADGLGGLEHRGQQRGHHAGPDVVQHDRRGLGRRHRGPPARPLPADPQRGHVLARQGEGRTTVTVYGRIVNTSSEAGLAGPVGQANYGRGEGGHHRADADGGARPGAVRRPGQRDRAAGADRDDRRRLRRCTPESQRSCQPVAILQRQLSDGDGISPRRWSCATACCRHWPACRASWRRRQTPLQKSSRSGEPI